MTLRRPTILTALAAGMVLVGWSSATLAEPPPVEPPKVEGAIQYVGPDTYILLDAEGRPQPVLGMSYDDFMAAWKKQQGVETGVAERRFTIDELRVSGQTSDDRARLRVELTIRTSSDTSIQVPLGMAGAILAQQPQWEAIGDQKSEPPNSTGSAVDYDPQAGGFVARLAGRPAGRQKLVCEVLVPLVHDGDEKSLRLNFPRALVSKLTLEVPATIVDAAVSEGAVLEREPGKEGGTRLAASGLAGDFRLTWTTAERERRELATVLSATGAIAISIDGHSIRSDAHLSVRSFGGSFDQFRVRLPPGAQLIQDRPDNVRAAPPSYRVSVAQETAAGDSPQIATIELGEKQFGPVEIDLSTEQPLGLPSTDRAVELAGFEVLGAVRQFGDVAVRVADDWQLRWESGPYVRQVERANLAAALRDPRPNAAFQYDRQPWSLRTRVVARPMVVHVAPDYALELGPEEARLRVHLNYQVPGARAFEFRVQLQGWELTSEPVESNGLVDRDGMTVTRDGTLVLPLTQASSRRAEVTLVLRRPTPRDATELSLPLPVPEADSVTPADMAVSAAPEVEMLPDLLLSRGLVPTPVTNDTPPDASASGEQLLHFRALIPDAVFAAKRTIRPRAVEAEIETKLAIEPLQIQATQDIAYWVQYQPIDQLVFDVPAGWSLRNDQIEIGQIERGSPNRGSAPVAVAVQSEVAPTDSALRQIRAVLPQPQMGKFSARLTFDMTEPAEMLGEGSLRLSLPRPSGVRIESNRATITSAPDLAVSLDTSNGSAWQRVSAASADSALTIVAAKPRAELLLHIGPDSPDRPQSIVVERAWLQTWQAGSTIQDRVVYRFRTSGATAAVELPPLVSAEEVEVLIDGRLADVSTRQEGRLQLELPSAERAEGPVAHTLELRYRRPAATGLLASQEFTPPQLVGSSTLSEIYWQFVLPGDRHIVRTPAKLVAVDARQWWEVFLGRRPSMKQVDLEAWSGATAELAPSSNQNIYLFSGLAPVASIDVLTAPRWLIVLATSGAVLALAMLWIHVLAVRRGWVGLLAATGIAALAASFPTPAVLVAQAAVLGILLSAVALLLQRRLARPRWQPQPTAGSTNLRIRSAYRPESVVTPAAPTPSGITPREAVPSGTTAPPMAVPDTSQ
jgi:hypothetical protein